MIRSLHWRDLPFLLRAQRSVASFNLEYVLTRSASPVQLALWSKLSSTRNHPISYICQNGVKQCGFLQTTPRFDNHDPYLSYLYPPPAEPAWEDVWSGLLSHTCHQLAERGFARLITSAEPDSLEMSLFKRLGFNSYAQETVYSLAEIGFSNITADTPLSLRQVRPADQWQLQKLYDAVVPKPLHYLEANFNAQASPQRWFQSLQQYRWVWPVEGELKASVVYRSSPSGIIIRPVLHPEQAHHTADMARTMLKLTGMTLAQTFVIIPKYMSSWDGPLRELGFEPFRQQMLLTKQMVVQSPSTVPVPAMTPAVVKAPTVPTVLTDSR